MNMEVPLNGMNIKNFAFLFEQHAAVLEIYTLYEKNAEFEGMLCVDAYVHYTVELSG